MIDYLKRISSFILDVLQTVIMAIAIFMVVYLFLMRPHQVSGKSMVPNFEDGEYLLTEKVTYRFNEPQRGDVIVFSAPPTRRQEYIKRIIAIPGDKIELRDDKIYLNDSILNEEYIPFDFKTLAGEFLKNNNSYIVPSNEYIVLGDNRENSKDSREFGPIKKSDIVGKAWVKYWPIEVAGKIPTPIYKIY